jgi:ribosomal protein S18 acetylase RimI-like enzyme
MINIEQLKIEGLNKFFDYLTIHLSENGTNNTPLFLPLTKDESQINEGWKEKFIIGLNQNSGNPGWRKLWIATNQENQIVGHIDIRGHHDKNTAHRVLLGMGVDSRFRKLNIGQRLVEFTISYCKKESQICWIDLQALTNNLPAIHLYKKMGFQEQAVFTDMFRIDNLSYDYTAMTLNVDSK